MNTAAHQYIHSLLSESITFINDNTTQWRLLCLDDANLKQHKTHQNVSNIKEIIHHINFPLYWWYGLELSFLEVFFNSRESRAAGN